VRLGWADADRALTQVRRAAAAAPTPVARAWIARAGGAQVESTFPLVPGWDPALEGESDAAYERGSAAFATYVNAYRLWALNEDGRFTGPPFSRGPAHDLAALFGEPFVRSRTLRFGSCLTLDDGGARRQPIVEVSLDSGATWSTFAGAAVVQMDRAAVYLDDVVLPPAFLAAAKANAARVRVTATLRSPNPLETLRWQGNPFRGVGEPRVFELGDAFEVRRVSTGSIHHAAVRSGSLVADEIDQLRKMDAWLMHRQERERLAGDEARRGTLELAGLWPLVRAGDRLRNAGASNRDPFHRSELADSNQAVVRSVRLRTPEHGAPVTSIDLTF
jgi:hypothetical protein